MMGVQTYAAILEINMLVSQKLGTYISRSTYTNLRHLPKEHSTLTQGHLLNYVHRSIIHNSQELETN